MGIMEWMIPLIVGAGFLIYGLYLLYNVYAIQRNGVNTRARVLERASYWNRGRFTVPMFQYKVDNQQIRSLGVNVIKLQEKYEVGDSVEIRYDPKRPKNFIIPNDVSKKLIVICITVGTILVATFIRYL